MTEHNIDDVNIKLVDARARASALLDRLAAKEQFTDITLFALQLIDVGADFLALAESLTEPDTQA